jgi:N-methylhydantoinase B/oxoprolinase/acetone carboxylase alpha subunit
MAGQPSRVTLERDSTRRAVRGKESLELGPGDLVVVETAGGGGYGEPAQRPASWVERDEREQYSASKHEGETDTWR